MLAPAHTPPRAPSPTPDTGTAAAAPAPGVSLAGGSSLVIFRRSQHADAAWRLIEFLSAPAQQVRFFHLTGNLPAHRAAWEDSALAHDRHAGAFWRQLQYVVPTPKIPEWEQIATRVWERAEQAIRGAATLDEALAGLDRDAERILAKRRWLLARGSDAGEPGGDRP
jgi:multiple sugar transport system substrate-binding protein